MSIQVNIGGDRLGSGNKMNVNLKGFQRSTHDLSNVFRSTMAPGTLVPFFQQYALNGDVWKINLNTMVRTIPTNVPLFGSYKVQLDVFQIPIRLYVNQLKNNRLNVGMNMKNITLPQIELQADKYKINQFDQSSLNAYLGIRGIGRGQGLKRKVNALGHLAYLDIFKNYYANKQEEHAFVISEETVQDMDKYPTGIMTAVRDSIQQETVLLNTVTAKPSDRYNPPVIRDISNLFENAGWEFRRIILILETLEEVDGIDQVETLSVYTPYRPDDFRPETGNPFWREWEPIDFWYKIKYETIADAECAVLEYRYQYMPGYPSANQWWTTFAMPRQINTHYRDIGVGLEKFKLENIDEIIEKASRNDNVIFTDEDLSPIRVNSARFYNTNEALASKPLSGLLVKTYQSDIFNNWVSTEWIDGENGINAITSVDTSGGSFTMDTLNLAQKVYDMLNRIAISGGTYEDWQEAIWGEKVVRQAQTPIYLGGASTEIVFDEVVSTAQTDGRDLGAIAGKGMQSGELRGGFIKAKINEPSILMGIASITPRVDYSQGNEWFINLKNMDNFHKPSLDGIGFQDLITEQMAHWDAVSNEDGELTNIFSAGKQPAWLNYMTNINKTYGEFANENSMLMMTLNRKYEVDNEAGLNVSKIKDMTTYIDPVKFNDAFSVKERTAQNFWVQISIGQNVRRKMSAKIIPNL